MEEFQTGIHQRRVDWLFLGIFSLSLFPMLQKYSFIDDATALLPQIVWPSTVRLGTIVVFDFLLITWLMVFQVFLRSP